MNKIQVYERDLYLNFLSQKHWTWDAQVLEHQRRYDVANSIEGIKNIQIFRRMNICRLCRYKRHKHVIRVLHFQTPSFCRNLWCLWELQNPCLSFFLPRATILFSAWQRDEIHSEYWTISIHLVWQLVHLAASSPCFCQTKPGRELPSWALTSVTKLHRNPFITVVTVKPLFFFKCRSAEDIPFFFSTSFLNLSGIVFHSIHITYPPSIFPTASYLNLNSGWKKRKYLMPFFQPQRTAPWERKVGWLWGWLLFQE